MGFEGVGGDFKAGLDGADAAVDDGADVDLAESHADDVEQADLGVGEVGLDVEIDELAHQEEHDQADQDDEDGEDGEDLVGNAHGTSLRGRECRSGFGGNRRWRALAMRFRRRVGP
ncbi:hypothetical protein J4558_14575 [Leptolyngbya sp. 15MV]|nr:hypothetical protein J4558_14575 [Leptolyngbya sp. 15MV]